MLEKTISSEDNMNYRYWIALLFGLMTLSVYLVSTVASIPIDGEPRDYSGSYYLSTCPECKTLFYNSWDGRVCPEDGNILERQQD